MLKRLLFLWAVLLAVSMSVQGVDDIPLVYNVENTGAAYPKPVLNDNLNELPFVQQLPDPFAWADGSGRSTDFADWEKRRNEIKAMIEHYEIGTKPERPENITATYNEGNQTLTVNVNVNGETLTLTSKIVLPEGDGKFPAIIGLGGGTGSLPSGVFTERNIAQIPFNYGQVMAHQQNRGSEPINKLYPELTYMGAYSAWSWGVSRLIDGIEIALADKIDVSRLAVTGCSFAGKMALFAGAFDERIALTIAQESGGGGYPAWRVSETIGAVENLGSTDYHWFIEDMRKFSGNNVPRLPHDHHELMAMVAPRALLVTGNSDMEWLADPSGYVSSRAVQQVYETFGIADRFGVSITNGHGHCSVPADLQTRVEAFVDKFLLGDETAETNIFAYPPAYEDINYQFWISDWADVVVPEAELEQYFYEAESRSCVDIGSEFVVVDDTEASNGQYLTITTTSNNDVAPTGGRVINLPVTVNSHGKYYLYFRLNCQSADNDSFWIRIGGRTFEKHEGLSTNGAWTWVAITDAELTKGRHVITIGYSGAGAKLDRIYITNSATEIPTGMGGVECECIALPRVTTFDFETGDIEGWTKQNPGAGITITQEDKYNGEYALKMVNGSGASAWSVQAFSPPANIVPDHQYKVSFWIRAVDGGGRGRISTAAGKLGGQYWADFNVGEEWTQIVYDNLTAAESPVRLSFDMGYVRNKTYYIDDIEITDLSMPEEPELPEVPPCMEEFPDFPPTNVNNTMDHNQMLCQVGVVIPPMDKQLEYETILLPKLQAFGTDITFKPKSTTNLSGTWTWETGSSSVGDIISASVTGERTGGGLWNNYIQTWEPGGQYFTGAQFYEPLPLMNMTGVTKATWPERRAQIFEEVQKVWGYIPAEADDLIVTWTKGESTTGTSGDVDYTQYTLSATIERPDGWNEVRNVPSLLFTVRIPTNLIGTKKAPIIIQFGAGTALNTHFLPKGIGTGGYTNTRLQPDSGSGLTSYLIGLVNKGNWRTPSDWGSLAAWSWGISRLIDYLETDANLDIDPTKVGVEGHSRYGKASLVAMAYDERVAIAFPSSSGSLGAAQVRRHLGQDLGNSAGYNAEYHWMAGNFIKYMGLHESSTDGYMPRKVMDMPVDAESLIALCAPRPIFIGSGDVTGDSWVDPYGQYLASVAATPVYELLDMKGVVMNDVLPVDESLPYTYPANIPYPKVDTGYLDGDIAYRRHAGGHSDGPNLPDFATFAARYLVSNGTTAINKIEEAKISFNNPIGDILEITIPENTIVKRITILDIAGRIVIENNVAGNYEQIPTSGLLKGVYILNIETEKGLLSYKVIKN